MTDQHTTSDLPDEQSPSASPDPVHDPANDPSPGTEPTQPIGLGPRDAGQQWTAPSDHRHDAPAMPLAMPPGLAPGQHDTRPMPAAPAPGSPDGQAGPLEPATGHHRARPGAPGWLWPAVAALALVVGLAGGVLGAALHQRLDDGSAGLLPGTTRTAAPLREGNESVSAVAQELLPSTVQILAESDEGGATGSGFVLDEEGHVITNHHVVAGVLGNSERPLQVVDFEGRAYDATVVGASQVYDLAVLEIAGAGDLRAASLGASEQLLVGDQVVAFGAPLGLSQTVTSGIVSALDRPVTTGESDDETSFINAVQTDAAINPGNSGGPLVNLAGQVVGVNSAIATTGGFLREAGSIGVGFAIPIEQVRITADQILRTGEARYPVIGAKVQTSGASDVRGARIDQVMEGTPAEKAGLREDDVVIAVNGERVTDGIALIVSIRTHQPGETLELTVMRDGDERDVSIVLDSEVG